MIDLEHRALFPLETGYALDLPSPLREYPPSSLHVSSSSPPSGPRPYAAPDSDSVCALQRQQQQETQGGRGRGWEASDSHQGQDTTYPPHPQLAAHSLHLPLHVFLPLSSLSLAAYPQYGSSPQQPHSASAAGLAPSPHACLRWGIRIRRIRVRGRIEPPLTGA